MFLFPIRFHKAPEAKVYEVAGEVVQSGVRWKFAKAAKV